MRKRKKYGNGTPVTNYIENPYEVLQEDKIDKAEAVYKAESSTGTQIMDVLSQAMIQFGMQQGGMSGLSDLNTAMKAENTMGNGGAVGGPGDPPKSVGGTEQIPIPPEYAAEFKRVMGTDIPANAWITQNLLDTFTDTGEALIYEMPGDEIAEITPEVEDTSTPPVIAQPKFKKIPIIERGNTGDVYVPDTPEYQGYGAKKPMSAEDWRKSEYYKANQNQKDSKGQYMLGNYPFEDAPSTDSDPNKFLYKGDWKNQWLINQSNPPVPVVEDIAPIVDETAITGAYGLDLNYAYGGNVPVEIEGDEVVETPDGQLLDVEGPSHEQGGVNTSLPEGSKVYSDRIKIAGKSMQERKKTRERKSNSLERLLSNNSSDVILKGSMNRVTATNAEQENKDMMIQKVVDTIMGGQPVKKAYGGQVNRYGNGTPPDGVPGQGEFLEDEWNQLYQDETQGVDLVMKAIQQLTGYDPNTTMGEYNKMMGKESEPIGELSTKSAQPLTQWTLPPSSTKGSDNSNGEYPYPEEEEGTGNKSNAGMPTGGDLLSIGGNLVSSFGPYLNTLKNRASDTPNINAYKDFGIDGLQKLEEAEQYVQGMRENKLRDAELAKTSALKRGRNSARGVNTMRALDLATEQGFQSGEREIYDQFATQMMQILGQESQGEFLQDKMVMEGDQTRDIYDRMDNDNFATQMATNIVGIGEGLQETGKDINTMKEREVIANLINQLSKYGFKIDEQGNVIQG